MPEQRARNVSHKQQHIPQPQTTTTNNNNYHKQPQTTTTPTTHLRHEQHAHVVRLALQRAVVRVLSVQARGARRGQQQYALQPPQVRDDARERQQRQQRVLDSVHHFGDAHRLRGVPAYAVRHLMACGGVSRGRTVVEGKT